MLDFYEIPFKKECRCERNRQASEGFSTAPFVPAFTAYSATSEHRASTCSPTRLVDDE